MTSDLEKQFFDTFAIEPDKWWKIGIDKDGNFYKEPIDKRYPQITDRILLELIYLFAKELNCFTNYWHTVEDLKKDVLEEFILDKDCFNKHQVQALFKEER